MGEQVFRIGSTKLVTDELLIGSTTGSITDVRTTSNSWSASDAYLSTGAQMQDKIDLGAPSGPEIKMASIYSDGIVNYTKRTFIPDEQGNYSNLFRAAKQDFATAWPFYAPTDMTFSGVRLSGKRYENMDGHYIYFMVYSMGGYSGTYRGWPNARQGYIKANIPSGNANTYVNLYHYTDDGTEGIVYDSNGNNATGFSVAKGHYWMIIRQDEDAYTEDPEDPATFQMRDSPWMYPSATAHRPPWVLETTQYTRGNSPCLISINAAWKPSSGGNWTPPASATQSHFEAWNFGTHETGESYGGHGDMVAPHYSIYYT